MLLVVGEKRGAEEAGERRMKCESVRIQGRVEGPEEVVE